MIFRILTLFILSFLAVGQEAPPETVFRAGVADVRVVVQVTVDNQPVKNLTKEDFVITDEGKPQEIAYFGQEKEPLNLLLLLDISGSMRKYIEEMGKTAREALHYLSPGDRIAIMTFGTRTNLHFDFFDNHAEVARQLATAIDDQEKVGFGTSINAALIEAAKFMAKDSDPGRRSVLIVTDNLGLNYQVDDRLTMGYLLKSDVVLNAIVTGRGIRPQGPKPTDNPDFTPADVFKIAEATGGESIKADQTSAFFPQMISRIRDRYTLAYHVPTDSKAGQFRRIAVSLTPAALKAHPNAIVRAREGYYVKE